MPPLQWLSDRQRADIDRRINGSIGIALPARHWGVLHRDSDLAHGRPARFYILDYRGLMLAAGAVRHALRDAGTRLLYRGQTREYRTGLVPSLFRNATNQAARGQLLTQLEAAMATIGRRWDIQGIADGTNVALAQHYGLKTQWLDVVDHVQMAAWFAYDLGGPPRSTKDTKFALGNPNHGARDDAVGYIFLLAVPEQASNEYCPWIDLRTKGSNWLRPHVQQGFVVRMADPLRGQGNLNGLHVATFIAPRPLLKLWASYDHLTPEIVYPNIGEDRGLEFWNVAAGSLKGEATFDALVWCKSE